VRIKDSRAILFSDAMIPNLFIQDVMPELSGNAVKCYLFLNSVSQSGSRKANVEDLADRLGMSLDDVDEALIELKKRYLVTVSDQDITISDLKMQELQKRYRPITSSSPREIRRRETMHQDRETMVNQINLTFFQGMMTFTWYDHIDRWFEAYGFEPEVIYALFQEASNNKKLSGPGYASRIAEDWAAAGVKTYEQLSVYYTQFMRKNDIKALVGKRLRRRMSEYDLRDVDRWVDEYDYDEDVIEEALSRTTGAQSPSVRYVGAILKDWYENGVKTVEDIETYERRREAERTSLREKAAALGSNRGNFSTSHEDEAYDDGSLPEAAPMPRIR